MGKTCLARLKIVGTFGSSEVHVCMKAGLDENGIVNRASPEHHRKPSPLVRWDLMRFSEV